MSSAGSVTVWIDRLKAGDGQVALELWRRYFQDMVVLARQKLRGKPGRVSDEEDVALCAFDSFCRGAGSGRFPHLLDRRTLWPLLVALTSHKAVDVIRAEGRKKRGGAGPARADTGGEVPDLEQVAGREPSPGHALEVDEECQRLLNGLSDAVLRAVAQWKAEGYKVEEIAAKLGCVPRTVERKLQVIRRLWGERAQP